MSRVDHTPYQVHEKCIVIILNVLTLYKDSLPDKCADSFSTVYIIYDLQSLNVHIHLVLQILLCIVLFIALIIDK